MTYDAFYIFNRKQNGTKNYRKQMVLLDLTVNQMYHSHKLKRVVGQVVNLKEHRHLSSLNLMNIFLW